jgi:hypothetical protein
MLFARELPLFTAVEKSNERRRDAQANQSPAVPSPICNSACLAEGDVGAMATARFEHLPSFCNAILKAFVGIAAAPITEEWGADSQKRLRAVHFDTGSSSTGMPRWSAMAKNVRRAIGCE